MDEFGQLCARLANEKVPNADGSFAETLDTFLTLFFAPTYRTLLKKRGVNVPLAIKPLERTVQRKSDDEILNELATITNPPEAAGGES